MVQFFIFIDSIIYQNIGPFNKINPGVCDILKDQSVFSAVNGRIFFISTLFSDHCHQHTIFSIIAASLTARDCPFCNTLMPFKVSLTACDKNHSPLVDDHFNLNLKVCKTSYPRQIPGVHVQNSV